MSMSMLHVHIHAACSFYMSFHAAWSCPCYMPMSMLHSLLHVHAHCTCCLYVHVHTAVYFHGHGHGTRTWKSDMEHRHGHWHGNGDGRGHSIIFTFVTFSFQFKIPTKENRNSVKISGSYFWVVLLVQCQSLTVNCKKSRLEVIYCFSSHKDWWIQPQDIGQDNLWHDRQDRTEKTGYR